MLADPAVVRTGTPGSRGYASRDGFPAWRRCADATGALYAAVARDPARPRRIREPAGRGTGGIGRPDRSTRPLPVGACVAAPAGDHAGDPDDVEPGRPDGDPVRLLVR